MGRYGIVHDTENRTSSYGRLMVNDTDGRLFQDIPKPAVVPFPVVEEIGNCGSVAGTGLFKINRFSFKTSSKTGKNYRQNMLYICLRIYPA